MSESGGQAAEYFTPTSLQILADDMLTNGSPKIAQPNTLNTIIKNTTEKALTGNALNNVYSDLGQKMNLYSISSALVSYDKVSNFGIDTIIEIIPETAGFNNMIIHTSGSGLDFLNST